MHIKNSEPTTIIQTSISRLPNEMMAYVFALCTVPPLPPYHRFRLRSVSDPEWILLTLVCRHWHDFAHATPTLWSNITVGRKAELLQLCLTRSASTALDIAFTSGQFPFRQLGILIPHARRIRTLQFETVREEWRAVLHKLLREPMPALEELRYHWNMQAISATYHDLAISSRQFPRLEVLHLMNAPAPRDPQTFWKLSSLSLENCLCDLTYDQFLSALSGNETLEELHLLCFLGQLASDTQPSTDARITLPRLSDLTLRKHHPAVSNVFLGHLVLPSLTYLKVHGYLGDVEDYDFTETLLPTDLVACMPLLGEMTSVAWRVHQYDYKMTFSSTTATARTAQVQTSSCR
ncbi:hypothetical protein C8Q74DRAFT_312060 [Fomes fomentarius]|nr:hypothetical protein C8Q74DRAFT_312060 [Fomes fomentarius]